MRKRYILYIVVILLSIINIINTNNTSALSYSSSVGVGFTFNPTLSVNISSNLIINNLVPGSSSDSNIINVSVASNAAYGYTLSAIVNGNNSRLTHTNGTNTFSSIATNADLSDLEDSEDTNIWGYSYKDNTVETPTWSNYNGLSNSNNTTLINANSNVSSNLDFKIAAKSSNTQAGGTYTGTINFTAVTNVAPMSLFDSFLASGAEMYNGYFKMQDMTPSICSNVDIEESELQLIDARDNKVYWVAKLKDGHCWMTQNLNLDLSHEIALTSETSDIDPDSYGKTIYTAETGYSKDENIGVVSWLPNTIDGEGVQRADTINMVWNGDNATVPGWTNSYNNPYSANPGDKYRYTNPSSYNESNYNSLEACANTNNNDISGCEHTHFGNYYNWSAAIASNNSINASGDQKNSICPKNWSLPVKDTYGALMQAQGIWSENNTNAYADNGFNNIRVSPLFFQRFGRTMESLNTLGVYGHYWSSTVYTYATAYYLGFSDTNIWPSDFYCNGTSRYCGFSVRCLAE